LRKRRKSRKNNDDIAIMKNKKKKQINNSAILNGIKGSIKEIKSSKRNGKKLQTLKGFLNESYS
jgi:hypothetical protein